MIISFQNDGEIDMRAVTTIGISAKEGDSPIGYFGSGLKYAISVILRSGGSITVWSGLHRYVFAKAPVRVRDQEFEVITMTEYGPGCEVPREPRELGFTTRLGVNWEGWQAFRELYCNTIDERGETIMDREGHKPREGATTIHVQGVVDIENAYTNRGGIVLTKEPGWRLEGIDIHPGESNHIYYRGILAAELQHGAAYCYNVLHPLVLTEDRTIKFPHLAHQAIARSIVGCEDKQFIKEWLTSPRDSFEYKLDLGVVGERPSKAFLDAAEEVARQVELPCNLAVRGLLARYREDPGIKPAILTPAQERQLEEAKAIVHGMSYDINKHPIIIVEHLGIGRLGTVLNKSIVLSKRCFDMGVKTVAGTLMEEHLHLEYQFQDCSRDFQNYLVDRLVTLAVDGVEAVGNSPRVLQEADDEPF